MTNLSIFERNVIHSFGYCGNETVREEAETMFLRGKDRSSLAAERAANDWLQIGETIAALLLMGAKAGIDQKPERGVEAAGSIPDLYAFIRERVYRRRIPGN